MAAKASAPLAEPLLQGRDLAAAREAYASGSVDASRAAHNLAANGGGMASEEHESGGGRLKGVVFGGLDGILTSFAIISGSVGANLSPVAILALGISNVLADALSMGAGEFLSSRSYNNYVRKEREREMWELQNYPQGEIEEMVNLFIARGMGPEDAREVIQRMAKYKDFFVDIMMTEELALPVPTGEDTMESLKEGGVMFASFTIFGMLPILAFVIADSVVEGARNSDLFNVACVVTALSLFGLGAIKAKFADKQYMRSGVETVLLGSGCAAVAYFVGRAVSPAVGGDGDSGIQLFATAMATEPHLQ